MTLNEIGRYGGIPIKLVLILVLLVVLRMFLVQKSLVLIKRLVALAVFFFLLFLILFPHVSTRVANVVGVGRGVDLVFYMADVFFLLLIVALWRRSMTLMAVVTRLSREIALQNASNPCESNGRDGKETS